MTLGRSRLSSLAATIGAIALAGGGSPLSARQTLPADVRASRGSTLCDAPREPLRVTVSSRADTLELRIDCVRDDRSDIIKTVRYARAIGSGQSRVALEDLSAPPLAPKQDIGADLYKPVFNLNLTTSGRRCVPLRATPLTDPPIPPRFLDQYQRWHLALAFMATPDCSTILVYAGNRFVVLRPADRQAKRLYQVLFSFR